MATEAIRAPDPKTAAGPLTGIWLSRYEYVSSGRGGETYTDLHYVLLIQHGANIQVRSLSQSNPSNLIMDLTQNGAVLPGRGARGLIRAGTTRVPSTTGLFSSCSIRLATGSEGSGWGTAGISI
jgi:hypothetical protein